MTTRGRHRTTAAAAGVLDPAAAASITIRAAAAPLASIISRAASPRMVSLAKIALHAAPCLDAQVALRHGRIRAA